MPAYLPILLALALAFGRYSSIVPLYVSWQWVTDVLLLKGAYNSIRESYERSTAAQRRVDSTTDTVRSSQQVRRAVDDLLRRRQDEFDNGYSINNVSLTNISIRIDSFRIKIRDLNDMVSVNQSVNQSIFKVA